MATFVNSATQRFLLNYFNRRSLSLQTTYSTSRTTTSATYVELNTEIQSFFLTWADEDVFAAITGSINGSGANFLNAALAFDGTTAESGFETEGVNASSGNALPLAIAGWKSGLAEGYHFVTFLGAINGGSTLTVYSSTTLGGNAAKAVLHVRVRG